MTTARRLRSRVRAPFPALFRAPQSQGCPRGCTSEGIQIPRQINKGTGHGTSEIASPSQRVHALEAHARPDGTRTLGGVAIQALAPSHCTSLRSPRAGA